MFRYVDDRFARTLEVGGSFAMGTLISTSALTIPAKPTESGFVNTSLFTGDIEFLNITGKPSYWVLPMTGQI
jgi:cathepsin D